MDTVWRLQETQGKNLKRKLAYRFYKKKVSSPLLMPFRSAQPINGKVASLTQDVFRIMSHCSPDTSIEERRNFLEEFSSRLEASGYPTRVSAHTRTRGGL